jgi:hypothetical protein
MSTTQKWGVKVLHNCPAIVLQLGDVVPDRDVDAIRDASATSWLSLPEKNIILYVKKTCELLVVTS